MRAIVWHGHDGAVECEDTEELRDETEAMVWVVDKPGHDLTGVVVAVGAEVATMEVGDHVILLESAEDRRCSSSLWGLTEFVDPAEPFGRVVRVPLAEHNLVST